MRSLSSLIDKTAFYQIVACFCNRTAPGLFGEWGLLRVWGRIGCKGQVHTEWFRTKEEAEAAFRKLEKSKWKRGYREKQ